ncbi:hypothetical protein H101_04908 [Trichophyton interdigitale H6]|nr:hypothetical protein H101_04908 [Trichophyton interdigitale H6]
MTQTENLTGQTADASLSPFVHTPPESPNHERKRAPENDPMVMNDVPNSDGPFSPPAIVQNYDLLSGLLIVPYGVVGGTVAPFAITSCSAKVPGQPYALCEGPETCSSLASCTGTRLRPFSRLNQQAIDGRGPVKILSDEVPCYQGHSEHPGPIRGPSSNRLARRVFLEELYYLVDGLR